MSSNMDCGGTPKVLSSNKENEPSTNYGVSPCKQGLLRRFLGSPLQPLSPVNLASPMKIDNPNFNTYKNVPRKLQELCSPSKTASPAKEFDSPMSFLDSPQKTPEKLTRSPRKPQSIEDFDSNSQDSGYVGLCSEDRKSDFSSFTEPMCPPPQRKRDSPLKHSSPAKSSFSGLVRSPQEPTFSRSPTKSPVNLDLKWSPAKSTEGLPWSPDKPHSPCPVSGSDGFDDFMELDKLDEDARMPSSSFSNLMKASIPIQNDEDSPITFSGIMRPKQPPFRRCLSMIENTSTPTSSRIGSHLYQISEGSPVLPFHTSFKRPEPPVHQLSPLETKRRRSIEAQEATVQRSQSFGPMMVSKPVEKLQRCRSEMDATIMKAVHKSSQQPDLIGDFTQPYALPLTEGKHRDLKNISPETLASLMHGEYNHVIEKYRIIDCRYPYEFNGGHIRAAENLHTRDQVTEEFLKNKSKPPVPSVENNTQKRSIIIFHCEFSSERAPGLCRFLRNYDRQQNHENYPALLYPEMYLLEGGYKALFEKYPELCVPQAYKTMMDPNHESEYRHFRAKSKSWSGDNKGRLQRPTLKRVGL